MVDDQKSAPDRRKKSRMVFRCRIVLFVVLMFVGYEFRRDFPTLYQGQATIQMAQSMETFSPDIESVGYGGDSAPHSLMLNFLAESLESRRLMMRVIADHDLLNNESFAGRDATVASFEQLSWDLRGRVKARIRPDTELIDVSVTHWDPGLARDLANWVAEGFVEQSMDRRLNTNRIATGALTNEFERLKIKLRQAEVALLDFRRTSGLILSLEERHSILVTRIRFVRAELDRVGRSLARVEDNRALVASFGAEPSVAQWEQLPELWDSEVVQVYRKMLPKIEMKMELLTLEHGNSHPEVEIEREMLTRVEDRIADAMRRISNRFPAEVNRLKLLRSRLQEQLVAVEEESLRLAEDAVEYNVLAREVEATKTLCTSVIDRIKEIDLTIGLKDSVVILVERAYAARDISPRRNLLVSALTGLVLALVGLFSFDRILFKWKSNG
jgi:polysaccharide biosynthesis transport protein